MEHNFPKEKSVGENVFSRDSMRDNFSCQFVARKYPVKQKVKSDWKKRTSTSIRAHQRQNCSFVFVPVCKSLATNVSADEKKQQRDANVCLHYVCVIQYISAFLLRKRCLQTIVCRNVIILPIPFAISWRRVGHAHTYPWAHTRIFQMAIRGGDEARANEGKYTCTYIQQSTTI